jgi:GH35 family endo-1,4-beta-xylanase
MKLKPTNSLGMHICARLSVVTLLVIGGVTQAADPQSLKDAFKDRFYIGTAINRSIATGAGAFRRSPEQISMDIAQVKEQFNQIVPENDTKWARIHHERARKAMTLHPPTHL